MNQYSLDAHLVCEACVYFHGHPDGDGDCRRYPPTYLAAAHTNEKHHWKHPLVNRRHWCGEFRVRLDS